MVHIRTPEDSEFEFLLDMLYESVFLPDNKPSKEELLNSPPIKKYHDGWGSKGDRAFIAINEENQPIGASWYRLSKDNEKEYGYVDGHTPDLELLLSSQHAGKEWEFY